MAPTCVGPSGKVVRDLYACVWRTVGSLLSVTRRLCLRPTTIPQAVLHHLASLAKCLCARSQLGASTDRRHGTGGSSHCRESGLPAAPTLLPPHPGSSAFRGPPVLPSCLHAPDPLRPHPRVTRPGPPSTGGLPCAPHLLQSAPPQPPPPPVLAICASRARNESQCSVNVCRRLNQGTQETRGEALVGGGGGHADVQAREASLCVTHSLGTHRGFVSKRIGKNVFQLGTVESS